MALHNALTDQYGRRVATLRISLTDHCNFRCTYCMPPEGLSHLENERYLSCDELVRFVRIAADTGVNRVKLTGGEPLIRKDVVDIVRALKAVDGVDEMSLTTNASRMAEFARPLHDAGLDRINISLDSLDRRRFADITRVDQLADVWAGIRAALEIGFPVKLNVVVLNDTPESEIIEFADLAVEYDIDVRFLEFMPLCGSAWEGERVYPIKDVRDAVKRRYDLIELTRGDKPAQSFRIAGGRGQVGFIASLTEPFCGQCSRMRLSADGKIRPCLFSNFEVDVAAALRNDDDATVLEVMRHAVWNKPWGSEFMSDPFRDDEKRERHRTTAPLIHNIGG